jgi:hypothetical protein
MHYFVNDAFETDVALFVVAENLHHATFIATMDLHLRK